MRQRRRRLSMTILTVLGVWAFLAGGCDKGPGEEPAAAPSPAGVEAAGVPPGAPGAPRFPPRSGPGMASNPAPPPPQTAPAGAATRGAEDDAAEEKLAYLSLWLSRHGKNLPDAPLPDLIAGKAEPIMPYMAAAAREGDVRALEGFLLLGGNVNRREHGFGRPLLNEAADASQPAVIGFLLKHGANPNLVSAVNVSPLMLAAGNGDLASVHLLLDAGAKVDLVDRSGLTALMAAASNGRNEVVAELIARHASLSIRTTTEGGGRTACDFARQRNDTRVLRLLEAAGGCGPAAAPATRPAAMAPGDEGAAPK